MATKYDLIIVGGGFAGSTLARLMAQAGARVLVLERTRKFVDRVRGEVTTSWGTAEAIKLGVYDLLTKTCGLDLPWLEFRDDSGSVSRRDLLSTTPQGTPFFAFNHALAQQTLLDAAEHAGAEVRRGARVVDVQPGERPSASIQSNDASETHHARLVIGADGRSSRTRHWGGFEVCKDPDHLIACGVLLEDMAVAQDVAAFRLNATAGQMAFWFPQWNGTVRAYLVYQASEEYRLSGVEDLPKFISGSVSAGADPTYFEHTKIAGPLASFNGADNWVPHPHRNGVTLIGDAAASSDAAWGEGISLALRDVRTLHTQLLENDNWDEAGRAYAGIHDTHYGAVHQVERWLSEVLLDMTPEKQARRVGALAQLAQDPTRLPDLFALGPETPIDEAARARFFGESNNNQS